MSVIELNVDNFQACLGEADILIIDFWAPWCGPCQQFAPTFEAEAENHPDITFGKINIDEEKDLAAGFKVRSIPTLMVFREKVLVFNQAGALPPPQFKELITKVKALDMEEIHKLARAAGDGLKKGSDMR